MLWGRGYTRVKKFRGMEVGVMILNTMGRASLTEKGCLNRLEGVSHAGNWEECPKWRGQRVQRPWGEPCRTTSRSEWLVQSEQQGGDVGGRGDNL